ncbi:WD40 repeat-like protein [Xylariaceae sp. FL0804]|nr:WD40 repeat-like protein [Xylariaceae sp. FL0804]
MRKGTPADRFFQTDADQAKTERRAAKAGNKNGNPIVLKSKLVAAVPDPASPSALFVAESSGSVRRIDIGTGETKDVFRGPSAPVTCVAVGGPGNGTVFAGSWDNDIWSWDVRSKALIRKYRGHADFIKSVICVRIGAKDCLISGGADKKIMVWDVETGTRLHVLQDKTVPMMAVQHLAVDPLESTIDSIVLVSSGSDPYIRRWRIKLDGFDQIQETLPDQPASVRAAILEHETTVYKLVFDTEGDEVDLWTASGDGTAKCLSRHKNHATKETLSHGDHVRAVALTDDWVVTAGRDENVKVWSRPDMELYCTLEGHYDEVTDLVVLAGNSQQVVSVSIDGTVRTWPLQKAELDRVNQEQEDKAKGIQKEPEEKPAEDLMTAEEEAELAALMED